MTKVRDLNLDMSKGLDAFMSTLKSTLNDDIEWTPIRARALEGFSKTPAGVKTSVSTLVDTDETFRASIARVIETDPDFAVLRERARTGTCSSNGKCAAARVAPTTRLYDGIADVSLALVEDDRVLYTRNGVSREAHALRCTDENAHICDATPRAVSGSASGVSLTGEPLQSAYRVRFAGVDDEYLVMNTVKVRNAEDCAARLCEHNAAHCPSSTCMLTDEKKCVPR